MNGLLLRLSGHYHRHPIAIASTSIVLVATLAIQIGRALEAAAWPQQWSFHHRIQFQRFEHAVPLFTYPGGGSNRFLPYLGAAHNLLHSGDSISKQPGATRFFLIRDSVSYRITSQWTWNEATRDFELAGRFVSKR
jgi:hypothetical protein